MNVGDALEILEVLGSGTDPVDAWINGKWVSLDEVRDISTEEVEENVEDVRLRFWAAKNQRVVGSLQQMVLDRMDIDWMSGKLEWWEVFILFEKGRYRRENLMVPVETAEEAENVVGMVDTGDRKVVASFARKRARVDKPSI